MIIAEEREKNLIELVEYDDLMCQLCTYFHIHQKQHHMDYRVMRPNFLQSMLNQLLKQTIDSKQLWNIVEQLAELLFNRNNKNI